MLFGIIRAIIGTTANPDEDTCDPDNSGDKNANDGNAARDPRPLQSVTCNRFPFSFFSSQPFFNVAAEWIRNSVQLHRYVCMSSETGSRPEQFPYISWPAPLQFSPDSRIECHQPANFLMIVCTYPEKGPVSG
jgi:hypothetical protein